MILGDTCTRRCGFCSVATGRPAAPDPAEPERVAEAVAAMELTFAVITMVTRDDLEDGGADAMARTVRAVRSRVPGCKVEVLPSDLGGDRANLAILMAAAPDVTGHNLETVRGLTPRVRSGASYDRSIEFLRRAREIAPAGVTKSAMMLGLGETVDDVCGAMDDLRAVDVDVLAIGQYLQPTRANLTVQRYWTPEEFAEIKAEALRRGFVHCEAGPWVRSSYKADAMYASAVAARAARSA